MNRLLITVFCLFFSFNYSLLFCQEEQNIQRQCPASMRFDGNKHILSDAEWKSRLTSDQYFILRKAGTEPPFDNAYNMNKEEGIYTCAGCDLPLFSSKAKYDSGTGWPSFWQPICPENVTLRDVGGLLTRRIEVVCSRCDGHLGDRFDDGPPPTGKRYCINSQALNFIPSPLESKEGQK